MSMINDLMAARVAIDPFLALVGLVELVVSEYVPRAQAFAVDPRQHDLAHFALIHPDDVDAFKSVMRTSLHWSRDPNDAEFAAWLYQMAYDNRR
jgi:hypothetical protein